MLASWADGHALYHRPSAQTHFVNDATVRLLREVLVEPRTLGEAATLLAIHEAGAGDIERDLPAILWRLEQLGLVRRFPA